MELYTASWCKLLFVMELVCENHIIWMFFLWVIGEGFSIVIVNYVFFYYKNH